MFVENTKESFFISLKSCVKILSVFSFKMETSPSDKQTIQPDILTKTLMPVNATLNSCGT